MSETIKVLCYTYHLPCRFHGTTSALFRRGFSAVSKLTCFGKENNLISSAKQLDFLSKTTCFPRQNNLFREAKQLVSETGESTACFGAANIQSGKGFPND